MSKVIPLSRPVMAHGEEVGSLELSVPTGQQVCDFGLPYSMTADGEVTLNMKSVKRYIVALAAVPASTVDQMAPTDINTIAWEVAGFFLQG